MKNFPPISTDLYTAESSKSTPRLQYSLYKLVLAKVGLELLLIIIGLVIFLVLHPFGMVSDGIIDLQVDPSYFGKKLLQAWDPNLYAGHDNLGWTPFLFPYTSFESALQFFSISLAIIQKLWFTLIFSISGISMLHFLSLYINRKNRFALFLGALFFALSPYALLNYDHYSSLILPYATLPLMFYALHRILNHTNPLPYYLLLAFSVLLMGGVNFTFVAIDFLGICIYLIYLLLSKQYSIRLRVVIYRLAISLSCTFALNIYWIWTVIYHFRYAWVAGLTVEVPSLLNRNTSYSEIWRSLGLWSMYDYDVNGTPAVNFAPSYQNSPILIIISYLVPLVLIFILLQTHNKIKFLLFALILITLPLMAGEYPVNSPYLAGKIYRWLYDHIVQFDIFRETYKFSIFLNFAFAVAIAFFVLWLGQLKLWNIKNSFLLKLVNVAVLLLICVNSWPFFAGRVFAENRYFQSVPAYWTDIKSCYTRDSDPEGSASRTLLTPGQDFSVYTWGKVEGETAQPTLKVPIIAQIIQHEPAQFPELLRDDIFNAIAAGNVNLFNKLIRLYDISYVLQRNDLVVSASPRSLSQDFMAKFLSSDGDLEKVCTRGALDLYKLKGTIDRRDVYAASDVRFLSNISNIQDVNSNDLNDNSVVFVNNRQPTNVKEPQLAKLGINSTLTINSVKGTTPSLNITKSSATEYNFVVSNATEPYWLVLPQSFNPDWVLQFDDGSKVPDGNHIIANGYANGWKIDRTGSYGVKLSYAPQFFYSISLLLSICASLLMLVLIFLQWFYKRSLISKNKLNQINSQEVAEINVNEESIKI